MTYKTVIYVETGIAKQRRVFIGIKNITRMCVTILTRAVEVFFNLGFWGFYIKN